MDFNSETALELYLKATKCENMHDLKEFKKELMLYQIQLFEFFKVKKTDKDVRGSSLIIFYEKAISVYNHRKNEIENKNHNNILVFITSSGILLTIIQIILSFKK